MGYFGFEWGEYLSVAEKRRRARRKMAELKREGRSIAPVTIEGRTIARSFWGQSWCSNLERYSDYATRLPRGRSYVRNGFVVDLQIARGEVSAMVAGSELYEIKIMVAPVAAKRWKAVCQDCAGTIDSLVELLQGRLAKGVMDRVCRQGDGLFPAPTEIRLSCSCPDWAGMCKHVAAALYGVGARLDEKPQLLFVLRGVDEKELLAGADRNFARPKAPPKTAKVLDDGDVAALFGLEMAETIDTGGAVLAASKPSRRIGTTKEDKASKPTKAPMAKPADLARHARSKAGSRRKAETPVGKKRARRPTARVT